MKPKKYADIIDVANQAGVSPATVSRCFNHPNKVRPDTRKRIKKAVELIKKENYLFNEVAYQVGFNSQSYFTKCFKKVYKSTPKEYFKH